VLLIAILVTSAFLWNVTYAGVQRTQLEDAIKGDVNALLDEEPYGNISLVNVKVEQDVTSLTSQTEKVIVTIARPPGEQRPSLHRQIDASVEQRVGHEIIVDIHVSLHISQ